ncbi:nucleotide sugar dehydrogenase [Paenibacillus lautus]|uniref:nucleotide sugar dehydrogenase n=1 Tax=Paenibacillus lautus TaxID=1401 RepID=UPI002DBA2917|nr:nucleotide sugar dehydrogenase [Paenibacillus lautus]MEC0258393.1 nucleotide sugar dehydrogenase [Paenibacillus lautus]
MKLCVIGLGYIGLPTAIMFARNNVHVHGVDINTDLIEKLSSGEVHIEEPGLQDFLIDAIESQRISFGVLPKEADTFIISVPTPIKNDKSANLDFVINAVNSIVPYIKKGNLIILESTVPPRTTTDILVPILKKTGLNVETELYVAHSPERVIPGKLLHELVHNDRIAGGINIESSKKTEELYKRFVKGEIHLTDSTTAEMTKCMENTYRDINIAIANELTMICNELEINVYEVIGMANKHPRVNIHSPGPGVGGHCLAVDPYFIYNKAPEIARIIKLARETNDNMPKYVADITKQLLSNMVNPKITIFGVSYKGDIDDIRESPSLKVLEILKDNHFEVHVYDPYIKNEYCVEFDEAVTGSDLILVLTDHTEFKNLDQKALARLMRTPILFDTKNIVPQQNDSELRVTNFGDFKNAIPTVTGGV